MAKKLTKTEIKKCLWFWFGKLYIRLRDTNRWWRGNCISSRKRLYRTEWQAGHFIPNGSCKYHTWNEDNVHFQSFSDNVKKYGNVLWYEDELRKKIWDEKVDRLKETKNELKQRKTRELEEMIKMYHDKVYEIVKDKDKKVRDEVDEYIKKYWKKMRDIYY